MLSDKALDILSQMNAAVVIIIAAIFIFGIIKFFQYKKEFTEYANQWRETENEKEKKEQQVQENTAAIAALKEAHRADMQEIENKQAVRLQQSLDIQSEFRQDIADTREAMKQILSIVHKIQEEAIDREIDQIRYKIIRFSKEIRYGDPKSQDEYNHIFQSIDKYHTLLDQKQLENGQIDLESDFIKSQYSKHLEENDFLV